MTQHFKPAPLEIVKRFKFHTRIRKPGESVSTFIDQLRSLAEFCNFGAVLEDMLRDRLVCGINDEAIQRRLLGESQLTYRKAMEIAQNQERAEKNVKELRASSKRETESQRVHAVGSSQRDSRRDQPQRLASALTCFRCGKVGHVVSKCRMRQDVVCHCCGKTGHVRRACKNGRKAEESKRNGRQRRRPVCRVQGTEEKEEEQPMLQVESKPTLPPIQVKVKLDDCLVTMEVDTGASMSLMAEATFNALWPGRSLDKTEVRLCSYSKEPIPVVGSCQVTAIYQDQAANLPLPIVKGDGPTLFGRNWLGCITLNWREIHQVRSESLQSVLKKYGAVFQEGLGTLQGYEAKIHIDSNARPRFCRARTVPYALRDKVETELERLQAEGTLEPVEVADWAALIVPVLKSDKTSVRICGDFRMTVNPVSKLDNYPIPRVKDLFAKLQKGQTFTKLDMSQAYQQLPLDPVSKNYVVINTHKGLFRYTRLPYGISSALRIFQRVMDGLLQGIPGTVVYLDDILITGASPEEHLRSLEEVLRRLDRAGLRLKMEKCEFAKPLVSYLGHIIDKNGLRPLPDKVRAIHGASTPRSVRELKSYLGLLTYYGKFLPNLSSTLSPLYRLLRKNVSWRWAEEEEKAFKTSKELLTSQKFWRTSTLLWS